jgi:glutathione synthase/RimK-type ligase-like ATP-grasp enzyme
LYVQYKKKKHEYRIHLGWADGRGTVQIDLQKKVVPHGTEPINTQIRNHGNGYVYARQGIAIPGAVMTAAHSCFEKLNLDFCAVDVIYNEHYDKAYVLEVNTAPGLEGQTVENYTTFFRDLIAAQ